MSDKKIHQHHYEESEENSTLSYKKQKRQETYNVDLYDEEYEELYIDLQRFLK